SRRWRSIGSILLPVIVRMTSPPLCSCSLMSGDSSAILALCFKQISRLYFTEKFGKILPSVTLIHLICLQHFCQQLLLGASLLQPLPQPGASSIQGDDTAEIDGVRSGRH